MEASASREVSASTQDDHDSMGDVQCRGRGVCVRCVVRVCLRERDRCVVCVCEVCGMSVCVCEVCGMSVCGVCV